MHKCPECGSARLYPSRTRGVLERLRRVVTPSQPYRCHKCDHRGWYALHLPLASAKRELDPDDLRANPAPHPINAEDFDRLDKI